MVSAYDLTNFDSIIDLNGRSINFVVGNVDDDIYLKGNVFIPLFSKIPYLLDDKINNDKLERDYV